MSPAETRLTAATLAAVICWICRALCQPRSVPLVQLTTARQHLRALGGQGRLTCLAMLLTVAAVVALLALPAPVHPDLRDLRLAAVSCGGTHWPYDGPTCYVLQPGGVWAVEEVRPDGTRRVVATLASPPFFGCSTRGSAMNAPPSPSLSFDC